MKRTTAALLGGIALTLTVVGIGLVHQSPRPEASHAQPTGGEPTKWKTPQGVSMKELTEISLPTATSASSGAVSTKLAELMAQQPEAQVHVASRAPNPSEIPTRASDAVEAEAAFASLPADVEWSLNARQEVAKQRRRLAHRRGIELVDAECRQGACRFEMVTHGLPAKRRFDRLKGRSTLRRRGTSAVYTTFEGEYRATTVTFLARGEGS